MQAVSSRIWTRVAVSISYDDNHYTTDTAYLFLSLSLSLSLSIYLSIYFSMFISFFLSFYQTNYLPL